MSTRVFVYDDNKGRQEAIRFLIENTKDMVFAGCKESCATVRDDMAEFRPHVVLMDIDMPKVNGIEGLKLIHEMNPSIFVIMQTVFEDEEKIVEAINAGAHGYFLKKTPPARLIDGIRDVLEGGAPMTPMVAAHVLRLFRKEAPVKKVNHFKLSPKEEEILSLLTQGMSYKMIAKETQLSYHTVNSHLRKIYEKLQVNSATEAVAKVYQQRGD